MVIKENFLYLGVVLIDLPLYNEIVNIVLALLYVEADLVYGMIIGIADKSVIYFLHSRDK